MPSKVEIEISHPSFQTSSIIRPSVLRSLSKDVTASYPTCAKNLSLTYLALNNPLAKSLRRETPALEKSCLEYTVSGKFDRNNICGRAFIVIRKTSRCTASRTRDMDFRNRS